MGKSQRQKIAEKIQREELADELRIIIQHARTISDDKRKLRVCYDKWYRSNEEAIETLTELKDKILVVNTTANAVAGIANLTEILGGVLSIAGAIGDKRSLMETGNKITKGGSLINLGTTAVKGLCLKDFCNRATKSFNDNGKDCKVFEEQRYSYFQELESFKRKLRTVEASNSFPLLLETAQREGIDFLGDLGLDDDAKSKLRTNLRKMCRSSSKKIEPATLALRAHDIGGVFATEIRGLIYEFKELLDQDDFLLSIFSEQTKKFLGETLNNFIPCLDSVDSCPRPYSGVELIEAGASIAGMSCFYASASPTQVGFLSGINVMLSVNDLIQRISDINDGSKSQESEELTERIEEMKATRENIIEEMRKLFGWQEPRSANVYLVPSLEY